MFLFLFYCFSQTKQEFFGYLFYEESVVLGERMKERMGEKERGRGEEEIKGGMENIEGKKGN